MTSATDALARARAELAAAEEMGSPEVDVAIAAVEQAEQAVEDEGGWTEEEEVCLRALRSNLDDERYFSQ